MTSITLTRSDAASTPSNVYRMDLSITSANSITPNLFVKQRVVLPDGTFDDTFATVANAADIEDYPANAPAAGGCYFLDSSVSLINCDIDELNNIFTEITTLLSLVCQQNDDLSTLSTTGTYTITYAGVS